METALLVTGSTLWGKPAGPKSQGLSTMLPPPNLFGEYFEKKILF